MDEPSSAKALVSKRAWERRRSCCDHFRHPHAAALDLAHHFEQAFIASVRRRRPLALFQAAIVTVVIVQPAEFQPQVSNRATQFNNFAAVALLDASPIHARIYVEEDSDAAAAPLPHLLLVFGQNGNAHLRELIGYFTATPCICGHRWISEKYVSGAAAAGHHQCQT